MSRNFEVDPSEDAGNASAEVDPSEDAGAVSEPRSESGAQADSPAAGAKGEGRGGDGPTTSGIGINPVQHSE